MFNQVRLSLISYGGGTAPPITSQQIQEVEREEALSILRRAEHRKLELAVATATALRRLPHVCLGTLASTSPG